MVSHGPEALVRYVTWEQKLCPALGILFLPLPRGYIHTRVHAYTQLNQALFSS